MTLDTALTNGRALAESLMLDACTIQRPTGRVTDDTTGAVTDTYTDLYAGACKVQVRDVDSQNPEAGDQAWTVLKLRVDVPMTVTGIEAGDVVTITAAVYDPDLVGRVFRVVAPFHGSQKTARRLPVEEMP